MPASAQARILRRCCSADSLGGLDGAGMFFQTTVSSLHHSWSGQIGTPHTAERDSASVEVRAQDLGLQLDLVYADPHSSQW